MLEPVSAIGLQFGIAAIYGLARAGNAVSAEARAIRNSAQAIVDRVENSDALFGSKAAAISALHGLTREHGEIGWDGGEAKPVDRGAIAHAIAFVRALPEGCELPEAAVEPDGDVSFDWMPSRHRMLSISVSGRHDRLAYAWLDGTDRGSAVARFDGITIPRRVLRAIAGVSSVDHAVFWAA